MPPALTLSIFIFVMILTIDIGNTLTKFGFYSDDFLSRKIVFPTMKTAGVEDIIQSVEFKEKVSAIVISSVVPELHTAYLEFSQSLYNLEPIFVDTTFHFQFFIN